MAQGHGKMGAGVLVAMLLATMVATAVIALLVVPPDLRGDRFALNLGFILFAEVITFAWPIYEASRNLAQQPTFPFNLGMGSLLFVFDVGIALIAALSATAIGWLWLVSLYIVWVLLLALFAGTWLLGARHVGTEAAGARTERGFHDAIRSRFLALSGSLEADGRLPRTVARALAELGDDIQHAASHSTADAVEVERRIAATFEDMAAACRAAVADASADAAERAMEKIRGVRCLFGERSALVKHRV